MKRPVAMSLALLLCSFIFTVTASAVDAPHDTTAGIICSTCHTSHLTLGSTGYNNICQNCHRPGDPAAGGKSITPADAANPFGIHSSTGISKMYQTSHRWDGSTTNSKAGAQPPVQSQMTTSGLLTRTGGNLACVSCHNQHSNTNGNFLRMANGLDQMCTDCHRSRNTTDSTKGNHPVGVVYPTNSTSFNSSPVNSNPANSSSAMQLLGGTTVSCSTCHGVHGSDSRSGTVDGSANFANLSSGDGYLLRTDRKAATADGLNICTNCHAGKIAHNGRGQNMQCADCHGAHVDTGDGSTPNVFLIKRDMVLGKPAVQFTSTSDKNYKDNNNTGVCQSCHAVPTGAGFQFHQTAANSDCNGCHAHSNSKGSFSVDAGIACTACHGYPPAANIQGSGGYAAGYNGQASFTDESMSGHTSHASTPYQKACVNCHSGNTHNAGTFQDVFKETAGTVAATGGLNPVYNATAQTCATVYCHSNANPRGGTNITKTTPSWKLGKGTIIGTPGECSSCHSSATDASPTWSAPHTRHVTYFTCTICHAKTAASNSAIFNNMTARAMHTNGVKDVAFGSFAQGGGWNSTSATCSNLYCHSNVQGTNGNGAPASFAAPVWSAATLTCDSCHVNMATNAAATGSHIQHAQLAGYSCITCHNGAGAATTKHADGTIDLSFSGNAGSAVYSKGGTVTPGSGYGSCSTSACHADPYSASSVVTPVWGTAAGCAACHTVAIGPNGPATGSHTAHAGAAACVNCHNAGTTATTSPSTNHIDGTITVTNGYPVTAKHVAGTYTGTCNNASCHQNPYGAGPIITPVWGTASGCAACHSVAIGPNGPNTGSHTAHAGAATCVNCHNAGTTATTIPASGHADGTITVTNGYPVTAKHAAGTYSGTCNTACHANPYGTETVTTPVWGTASGCTACHTVAIGPNGPATGSHMAHANAAECVDCHNAGTTPTSIPASGHADGTITVTNGYPATAKHAAGTYTGTCNNASCHQNPYGAGPVITPVWGTASGCSACHTVAIGDNGPATGGHTAHAGILCVSCHTAGTTKTSAPTTGHIDTFITVSNGYPVTTRHATGTYTGTCSTSVCHGQGAPSWGATTAAPINGFPYSTILCEKCHSVDVTALKPFYSTAMPKTTNNDNAKVGAHTAHIIKAGLGCIDCHGSVSLNGATHKNGVVNFTWNTLAKNGEVSPSYNPTSGTCSNVYCHGDAMPGGDTSGSNSKPVWNNTAYLSADLKVACGTCHGFPPSSSSHSSVTIPGGFPATATIGTTCSCHSNIYQGPDANTSANIFYDKSKHINGIVEGGECNSCHGYPPVSTSFAGAGVQNNWTSAKLEDYLGGGGAHTINGHVSKTAKPSNGFTLCFKCHSPNDHKTSPNEFKPSQNIKVQINQRYRMEATKQARYTSNRQDGNLHIAGNCSNISCHFGATPTWTQQ